jgi:hypothetical protein
MKISPNRFLSSQMIKDIHLPRFFCKYNDRQKIVRVGEFVYVPDDTATFFKDRFYKDKDDAVWPRSWDYYKEYHSIVLLGPPRYGKTKEFLFQCSKIENGFYLPLRNLVKPEEPETAFEQETSLRWGKWLESHLQGELFIDALDEGKLDAPKLIGYLVKWLRKFGTGVVNRLRIHLSCREFDWTRIDESGWSDLFQSIENGKTKNQHGYIVLALLDLDERAIREYCTKQGADVEAFFSQLPGQGKSFLQRPETLQMIVQDYLTSGRNSQDLRELYERIIDIRLQEYNEFRQDFEPIEVSLSKKLEISEHYAVSTQMSGKEIIAEFGVDLEEHVPFGLSGESLSAEREVFSTQIFEKYANGQYRFAEPGLTDYLAARRLNQLLEQGSIRPDKFAALFFPSSDSEEMVPQLRNLAGWLCALNVFFRQIIIKRNPNVVLHDYVGSLCDDDRVTIWRWLVNRFSGREWFDSQQLTPYIGQLACESLIQDLKTVISQKGRFGRDLRLLALEIIRKGKLKGLTSELLTVLRDLQEDSIILIVAAEALAVTAPEQLPVLKDWLDMPREKDPKNYLLGTALDLLWPDHIDLNTLITHLRPQESAHLGTYWSFFLALTKRLSPDDRAQLLDVLALSLKQNIQLIESDKQGVHENWSEVYYPVREFDRFLLAQFRDWKDQQDKAPRLEVWLSVLTEAATYGLVTGLETQKIAEIIQHEHNLRQQLMLLRIERLFGQEADGSVGEKIFSHNNIYLPQKEDLNFWHRILNEWGNRERGLLEAAWECFELAWSKADYPPEVLDWLEKASKDFPLIRQIWEHRRQCPYDPNSRSMKWRFEEVKRKETVEQNRSQWINVIRENISSLRLGNKQLLVNIISKHLESGPKASIEKWIEDEIDSHVAQAFLEGLQNYWANINLPQIDSEYLSKTIPLWTTLVLLAVDKWFSQHGEDWASLPQVMRQKALVAGLWKLNGIPDWYPSMIGIDSVYAEELFTHVFDMEAESEDPFPRLANRLRDQGHHAAIRQIVFKYLIEHKNLRIQVALPMMQCIMAEKFSDPEAEHLWEIALARYEGGDEQGALRYLAALWRFRPDQVWKWFDEQYLRKGEERRSRFDKWISAIEDISLSGLYHALPVWVDEKTLISMLPDLYFTYPPEADPSLEEFNTGDHDIQRRSKLGHLRNNTRMRIAESGLEVAGDALKRLLDTTEIQPYRDSLLDALDTWRRSYAARSWIPLTPEQLWRVLTKGFMPVQNDADFFELVYEILREMQADIEKGEIPVKFLLWYKNNTGWKPQDESALQILLAEKIRNHPMVLNQRLVSGRELEVGGDIPDIFITCILISNKRSKIYIEVKRQQNRELLDSPSNQLAQKYLKDPEARYGFYVVGWYGKGQYSVSRKSLNVVYGEVPNNPQSLETCLQRLCDDVVQSSGEIDGIRAIVIDVSLKEEVRGTQLNSLKALPPNKKGAGSKTNTSVDITHGLKDLFKKKVLISKKDGE